MWRGHYTGKDKTGIVDVVIDTNGPNARSNFFTISIEGTGSVEVTTKQKGMDEFQPVVNSPIVAGGGAQKLEGSIKVIRLDGTGPYTYSIDASEL